MNNLIKLLEKQILHFLIDKFQDIAKIYLVMVVLVCQFNFI